VRNQERGARFAPPRRAVVGKVAVSSPHRTKLESDRIRTG
jgi:hypothetical protein